MALERMYSGKRSKAGFSHQKMNTASVGESHSNHVSKAKTGKVTIAQLVISRRRWRWLSSTPRSMASKVGLGRMTTVVSLRRMAGPSGE
ncbi:hypothetical protein D3C76_1162140 [compost metagenome]